MKKQPLEKSHAKLNHLFSECCDRWSVLSVDSSSHQSANAKNAGQYF